MSGRIVVVVATGTDVGKTHVTCALLAAARAGDVRAVATKPVATGLSATQIAEDAALHARASGVPYRAPLFAYARPVSPHLAAREEGRPIVVADIASEARALAEGGALVVVETAGGLFSPLGPSLTNADLLRALAPCAWVLVAPDRLGVLHDLGATLRAARGEALGTPHVVLSAPAAADASTGTNAAELNALGIAPVVAVFPRASLDASSTREAGGALLAALEA